jgi:hypothetical protein
MPAVKKDLYIEQGTTYRLSVQWATPNPVASKPPDPVNLTGYTARLQIRKAQQTPVLVDATTETGEIEVLGTLGTLLVTLSATQTTNLNMRTLKYDLEVESPDGEVDRLLEGAVTVSANITQDEGEPVVTG